MIRLVTTRHLRRLQAVIDAHWQLMLQLDKQIADLQHQRTGLRDTLVAEILAGRETTAQRDQARAIAVDLEQELAEAAILLAGGDGAADLVRQARDQRDRMAALADTMQAAAEAADIPIVAGLDVDDYRAAVKSVLADIAARKKAAADHRALTIADPEAACRAAEADADWAARPEAL